MMFLSLLVVLLYCGSFSSLNLIEAEVYYVIPNQSSNESCPSEPCFTLNQYAHDSSRLFTLKTNFSLAFLAGIHNLTQDFIISSAENILFGISGEQTLFSHKSIATINVLNGCSIIIRNVSELVVVNIRISAIRLTEHTHLDLYGVTMLKLSQVEFERIQVLVNTKGPGTLKNSAIYFVHSKVQSSYLKMRLEDAKLHFESLVFKNVELDLHIHSTGKITGVHVPQKLMFIGECKFSSGLNSTSIKLSSRNRKLQAEVFHSTFLSHIIQEDHGGNFLSTRPNPGVAISVTSEAYVSLNIQHCQFSTSEVIAEESSKFVLILLSCIFGQTVENSTVDDFRPGTGIHIRQRQFSFVKLNVQKTHIGHLRTGINIYIPLEGRFHMNLSTTVVAFNEIGISLYSSKSYVRVFMDNVNLYWNGPKHTIVFRTLASRSSHIQLENCNIRNNFANRGAGIRVLAPTDSTVILRNVNFSKNADLSLLPAIVLIFHSRDVRVIDCIFWENVGTPVEIISGKLLLSGNTTFEKNFAFRGGGVSLISSYLYFNPNSIMSFISNEALDVGGAIYISKLSLLNQLLSDYSQFSLPVSSCFFQIHDLADKNELFTTNISLNFFNNSAGNGGEVVYGTYLATADCIVSNSHEIVIIEKEEVQRLFKIHNSINTSLSAIASNPKRICICDISGVPQCTKLSYIYFNATLFPGENYIIPLVVVGDDFGTVTAPVYARLLGITSGSMGNSQSTQLVNYKQCNNVEYSIHSLSNTETIILTASGSNPVVNTNKGGRKLYTASYSPVLKNLIHLFLMVKTISPVLLQTPIYINVTLENCPLGFELEGNPPSCNCHHKLTQYELRHCVIMNHTGFVYRGGTVWVNATFNTSTSNGAIVHKHCPYGYCRIENISVDLRYPDLQCALGHSGILCGGCKHNLSLALGSDRCLQCPNSNHLSLLIFFAAAGIFLVSFIKILNFTTTKGAINGLVFYTNIVWAHQSILFSDIADENVAHMILKIFIAWMNLDFGIETCFVQGLNAFWKTCLQFVFPVYIWAIAGFMIVTSHYSSLATKLFGNNSVPVLATLFLLSYAKLLRTIITSLGFALLHYSDRTVAVWRFDGNVPYFGIQHTFLFLAAICALILLWLPYMSTLLLVPWLRRKAYLKPFRWIIKWKPFYDAYFGPFKERHQYWVGVLLVVRGVMLIMFATTSAIAPSVNLVAMVVIPAVILLYVAHVGLVYKIKYLSLLENLFFINLIILGVGALYQNIVGCGTDIVAYVSVGIAFLQFLCIVLYHCLIAVKNCVQKRSNRYSVDRESVRNTRLRERKLFHLREELLESNDQL